MLVLFLITATLFASYLVRIYAWRTILGENGLLNSGLERLGLIDEPLGFLLYSRFAVTVALVHIFLPYVVLVLFAGFRPIAPGLLEAAQDLGANALTRWRKVILPLIAAPARDLLPLRLRPLGGRLRDAAVPRRAPTGRCSACESRRRSPAPATGRSVRRSSFLMLAAFLTLLRADGARAAAAAASTGSGSSS